MVFININFDSFGRPESPLVTVCHPDSVIYRDAYGHASPTRAIGIITCPDNFSATFNFNAYSEVSFEADASKTSQDVFNLLAPYVSIYLEGIGFFIIQECTETRDNEEHVVSKAIQAYSAECELSRCEAPAVEDGVYDLKTILDRCATLSPRWSFRAENIQADILSINRNFVSVEYEDLYAFLMECLQSKYDCVFEFDIINREVFAVSKASYVSSHLTDIQLANHNIINKLEKSVSASETYTAIRCKGGNDLDIRDVNPIGGNVLYDFSYRMPLMSEALQKAVQLWKETVDYYTTAREFGATLTQIASYDKDVSNYKARVAIEKSNVEAAQIALDATIANNPSAEQLENAKAYLSMQQSNLLEMQQYLDSALAERDSAQNVIKDIQKSCRLSETAVDKNGNRIFTQELLSELSSYINTAEYTNEDITKTDNMTFTQIIEQERQLMREGQEQLQKVSTENAKFTVTTNDFLFDKMFLYFTKQLEPGSIVYAESSDGVFEQFHISEIKIGFSDQTCELTFSNKYNKYDINSLFDDVFGKVSKSVSNIQKMIGLIEDQQPDIESWMEQVRRLTVGNVISSTNEDVIISESGYWGRRVKGYNDDGTPITDVYGNVLYDPEQIKIIHNGLYITDDNWASVKTAIGKLITGTDSYGNPTYSYGVIGDVIIGKLLIGNTLYIQATNQSGETVTTINQDGVSIYNGGIKIFAGDPSNPGDPVLYTTLNGDLAIRGHITANSGNIAGWKIQSDRMFKTTNNGDYEVHIHSPVDSSETDGRSDVIVVKKKVGESWQYPFVVLSTGKVYMSDLIVQNGGITITNNDGETVFCSDNSGDLYVKGTITSCSKIDNGVTIGSDSSLTAINFWSEQDYTYSSSVYGKSIGRGGIYTDTVTYDGKSYATMLRMSPFTASIFSTTNGNFVQPVTSVQVGSTGGCLGGTWSGASGMITDSDEKLKNSIESLDARYEAFFDKLKPSRFKYNNGTSNRYHTGLIAQEMGEALTHSGLDTNEVGAYVMIAEPDSQNTHLGIRYEELIALCIMKIQKLQERLSLIENK